MAPVVAPSARVIALRGAATHESGRSVPEAPVAIEHSAQVCAWTTTHEELDSDSMCANARRWSSRHASAMAATDGATNWKAANSTRIRERRGWREKRMAAEQGFGTAGTAIDILCRGGPLKCNV